MLLTLLLAGAPAAAQFASMVPADAETTAEDAMLLERALAELEAQHKVLFLYKSDLVDAKTVRLPETASLDAALQQMLTPHALKYARVGERSYVIVHRDDPVPGAVSTTAGRLQTGAITGTVYDNMDTPLPGAQVALEGTMLGDVTGTDGTYSITGVPAGDYTVRASFVGFTTQQVEVTIPDGETVTQDFTLSPDVMQMEGVVTTATRSERTQKEATVSLSVLSAEDIQEVTPNSQADILRSVPGVHTEGGGGEAASNVFVRGLPAPGQYKYNPIEENGMPVQAEGRMTTSARDIYYRYDLNVERLEFVRGGSSALFGVGSPAGIINYIDKTGSAVQETILQTQVGQNNLYRFDFHTSGPLSENYRYSLGGFYRYDEGPVVTGLPTEGLQLKGNITRLLDDGYLRL
ncbi:MAG: TonB-dependent receptor plug domain-containing protein, partial [Bacteroidetes bacterium]|nr:TonB-dependent receptor plug domain-containing protein [Bacteroidota bacterium]